jgi:hypothetical protein
MGLLQASEMMQRKMIQKSMRQSQRWISTIQQDKQDHQDQHGSLVSRISIRPGKRAGLCMLGTTLVPESFGTVHLNGVTGNIVFSFYIDQSLKHSEEA